MAFDGSQHFKIARPIVNADATDTATIVATRTLTDKSGTVQILASAAFPNSITRPHRPHGPHSRARGSAAAARPALQFG